jgi:hypothetical protein
MGKCERLIPNSKFKIQDREGREGDLKFKMANSRIEISESRNPNPPTGRRQAVGGMGEEPGRVTCPESRNPYPETRIPPQANENGKK